MSPSAIRYQSTLDGLTAGMLHPGFFDGWWNAPDADTHWRILTGSDAIVVAIAGTPSGAEQVVGFVTALTDGVLYGVITLLEVVPDHKGTGIGRELMRRVTEQLAPLYRMDLVCADDVLAFYAKVDYVEMPGAHAVGRTDRAFQSGRGGDGAPAAPRPGTVVGIEIENASTIIDLAHNVEFDALRLAARKPIRVHRTDGAG